MKSLIHPYTLIDNTVTIGVGCPIFMRVIIDPSVTIGDNCVIYLSAIIEHKIPIGNDCFIASGVFIVVRGKINSCVFLKIGSRINEKISIDKNFLIRADAVVINDISPNPVVAGVPARAST